MIAFVQERLASFAPGSRVLKLVDTAKEYLAIIASCFSDQADAAARLAVATDERARAREHTRESAKILLRTVRTFSEPPTTATQVDVNGRSDLKLLAAVRKLRDHASAIAGELPDHGLPADFVQTLSGTIDGFAAACEAQDSARDAHATAITNLEKNIRLLMDIRRKLDVIVRNQFRDDEGTLEVWRQMRRIGRGPAEPKKPPVPATKTDAESDAKSDTGSDSRVA